MKPNDVNGKLPTVDRPFRVLIIAGSNRRQYNCPGVDFKARTLMLRMGERLPQEWEVDYEDLGNVYGRDHKNPELGMQLEHSPEWKKLSVNHLEGRTATFYCYGDGGSDEPNESGRPQILRHPEYFNPKQEPFDHMREAYGPLVWQCRYGGVEVPDSLWRYLEFGKGKKYSDNQAEPMERELDVDHNFDEWTEQFTSFVHGK